MKPKRLEEAPSAVKLYSRLDYGTVRKGASLTSRLPRLAVNIA